MPISAGTSADQAEYVVTTSAGRVRLLLSDTDPAQWVFTNGEIDAFLALEGENVKRAAAQAIDTNASNEVLASKVLRTQDLTTDGAKLADALRKHAAELRAQADAEVQLSDDGIYFDLISPGHGCPPELTQRPYF